MPHVTSPLARNNPLAFPLIAVALSAALATGASFSGVASGAVQDLLRSAGLAHESKIVAEQHNQATELEKIELSIARARADIALLNARIEEAENSRREAVNPAPSTEREPDLGALRISLDEQAERNRIEFNAAHKRIDWLEKLVYNQDAAGSVQPAPARRHSTQSAPRWFVLHAEKDVAVIAGKGGAISVTPGFMVPHLGRVAAIRQEAGRWVVVIDKGRTIRER